MSGRHVTVQDAREALESAQRHESDYRRLLAAGEGADAYRHLTHAVSALERLASAADALRAPLVEAQVAHQTDQADALNGVWAEGVGDREYGFDPEGGRP